MSERIHIVMPADLIARIDAQLPEGVSRGEWIRRAIQQRLDRETTLAPTTKSGRPRTTGR